MGSTAEELEREVATPVSWDVGAVTGVHIIPRRRAHTQRGCYDRRNANAFQLDGRQLGSFIATPSFDHSARIRGGGENVAYAARFATASAARPWRGGGAARLTMAAVVGVPTIRVSGEAVVGGKAAPGVGQLSFGFYLNDTLHSGKKFCFVLQMFDSRRFGDGNGQERVSSDTFTPFVSVPLLAGTRYASAAAGTRMRNAQPFDARPFRVSVSAAELSAAIAAVNAQFPGTDLGTDLDSYALTDALVLQEVLRVAGAGGPNNVEMGVSVENFTVAVEQL